MKLKTVTIFDKNKSKTEIIELSMDQLPHLAGIRCDEIFIRLNEFLYCLKTHGRDKTLDYIDNVLRRTIRP